MLGLTEQSGDIMRTVDKLDKIGVDTVSYTHLVSIFSTGQFMGAVRNARVG